MSGMSQQEWMTTECRQVTTVRLSTRGCVAELSSSGRGGDFPRTARAGFSEAVVASDPAFNSTPTGLGAVHGAHLVSSAEVHSR